MSKIEVNTVEPQCGTTLTLGASGDTITIPAGATITNNGTQTGFGRTGAVDWVTTPKTSTFTAVSGEGYFINSGSALTMNLPAGSAGAIVAVSDYARNFATYPFSISANGSEKIGGEANNAALNIDGQAATFVYVDSTKGWINIQNAEDTETGVSPFISATGGTITTSGDYKIHTFTGPGTFTVSNAGNPCGSTAVDYMVVGGGGAGAGKNNGGGVGGGGAGGIRIGTVTQPSPLSPAPLVAPGKTITATSYPIVVGGGGTCSTNSPPGTAGVSGSTSSALCFSAAGGGGGNDAADNGTAGGSGGGGGEANGCGGAGNTPPVSPAQGSNGGTGNSPSIGGGGGGFTQVGESSEPPVTPTKGKGGNGIDAGPIFGTVNGSPGGNFGGGGGASVGGPGTGPTYPGGTGGGGIGNAPGQASASGVTNTGGGGGGHGSSGSPQGGTNAGGSGIVIIRYKFQ